jgi:hypothetical protein
MELGLAAIAVAILVNGLMILEGLSKMALNEKLQTSLDELVAEVADTNGKLDSALVFINGVPDLIADAVADALAQNNVDEEAAAAAVDAAREAISNKSDEVAAAIDQGSDEPVEE